MRPDGHDRMHIAAAVAVLMLALTAAVVLADQTDESDGYPFTSYIEHDGIGYHIVSEDSIRRTGNVEVQSVNMDGTIGPSVDPGVTSVEIPASFVLLGVTYTVTGIGESAFEGCTDLISVEVDAGSLTTVGDRAFYGCTSLEYVHLGNSVVEIGESAFEGCASLETLYGTMDVEKIMPRAFDSCVALTDVSRFHSLWFIGEGAFRGCGSLRTLEVSDVLSNIVADAFSGCGSIVFEVHKEDMNSLDLWIGHGAFAGMDSAEFVSADVNRTLNICKKDGSPIGDLTGYSGYAYYVWSVPMAEHTVTVVWDDGTTETSTHTAGDVVELPALPDKPGYVLSWTSGDVSISGGSFVMPDRDVTVRVNVTEIVKGDQDAPAPGVGYTIDYIAERAVAEPGYQVSESGENWRGGAPVKPGGQIHVRLAETDALNASPATVNVIEDRPVTPEPELVVSGDSVSVTDPRMEIWINGFGWSKTISGLTIGQEYHLTIRLAATATSFYGTFQFETITAGTPPDTGKGEQDAPSADEGYVIDYVDESVAALEGYEVSDRERGPWSQSVDVEPGRYFYVRLAETDDLLASPHTRVDVPNRGPGPGLGGHHQTVEGTTSAMEYRAVGQTAWTTCPDGDLTLAPGVYEFRYKAVPGESFASRARDFEILPVGQPGDVVTVDGLEFEVQMDGTVAIVGYTGSPTYIPAMVTINGVPHRVSEIGGGAFAGCASLVTADVPDGVVRVGGFVFEGCTSLVSASLPDSVTSMGSAVFRDCTALESVTLPDHLTDIGDEVFSGCSSLRSVTLPGSLTGIGWSAFAGCSSLESLDVPDGVVSIGGWTFEGCSSLREVALPDGLAGIGDHAFIDCGSLESLDIPDSVTEIGVDLFNGCASLRHVSIPDHVTVEGTDSMFNGCASLESFTMPSGFGEVGRSMFSECRSLESVVLNPEITYIGDYAFYGCSSLTSIDLPEGLESIGSGAFQDCTSLESVSIPDGVASVGRYAFYGCASLESAALPDGLTSIGGYAFYGCSSLKTLDIPGSVGEIGERAFEDCASLTSAHLPDGLVSVGHYAFAGCSSLASARLPGFTAYIGEGLFLNCTSLTDVVLPDGIAGIPESMFAGCSSLESVDIPDSVTSIEWGAFYGCSSLVSVAIPGGVTSVGGYAFRECLSLEDVVLPDRLTMIDGSTFAFCTSLVSVSLPDGLVSLGDDAFFGCSSLRSVTIPAGVASIGDYAFGGCWSLSAVMFESSEGGVSFGTDCFSTNSTLSVYAVGWDPTAGIRESLQGIGTTVLDTRESGAVQSSDIGYTGLSLDLSEAVSILFPGGDVPEGGVSYAVTGTDAQSAPSDGWTGSPTATHAGQYRLWYEFEADGRSFSGHVDVTVDRARLEGILSIAMDGPAVPGTTVTAGFSQSNWSEVSYQWYRGTQPILGADGASYTLTDRDAGRSVYVVAVPAGTSDYGGYVYSYVGQQGSQSAEGVPEDGEWPPASVDAPVIGGYPDSGAEPSEGPSGGDATVWIAVGVVAAVCVVGAIVFLRRRS